MTISEGGQGGHPPVTTQVSPTGLWSAEVSLAPGGPYSLTLTQEAGASVNSVNSASVNSVNCVNSVNSVTLTDVLAGDVWVSN